MLESPSLPPVIEQQPVLQAAPDLMLVIQLLHMHYRFIQLLLMPHEMWQLRPKDEDIFTKATDISSVNGSIFTIGLGKVMYK
jgi:hypothetical protein